MKILKKSLTKTFVFPEKQNARKDFQLYLKACKKAGITWANGEKIRTKADAKQTVSLRYRCIGYHPKQDGVFRISSDIAYVMRPDRARITKKEIKNLLKEYKKRKEINLFLKQLASED